MATGFAWQFPGTTYGNIYMDGVSDTVSIDMTDYIAQTPVLPKTATAISSCSVASLSLTTSLSKNVVTITFSSVPAAGVYGFNMTLVF